MKTNVKNCKRPSVYSVEKHDWLCQKAAWLVQWMARYLTEDRRQTQATSAQATSVRQLSTEFRHSAIIGKLGPCSQMMPKRINSAGYRWSCSCSFISAPAEATAKLESDRGNREDTLPSVDCCWSAWWTQGSCARQPQWQLSSGMCHSCPGTLSAREAYSHKSPAKNSLSARCLCTVQLFCFDYTMVADSDTTEDHQLNDWLMSAPIRRQYLLAHTASSQSHRTCWSQ